MNPIKSIQRSIIILILIFTCHPLLSQIKTDTLFKYNRDKPTNLNIPFCRTIHIPFDENEKTRLLESVWGMYTVPEAAHLGSINEDFFNEYESYAPFREDELNNTYYQYSKDSVICLNNDSIHVRKKIFENSNLKAIKDSLYKTFKMEYYICDIENGELNSCKSVKIYGDSLLLAFDFWKSKYIMVKKDENGSFERITGKMPKSGFNSFYMHWFINNDIFVANNQVINKLGSLEKTRFKDLLLEDSKAEAIYPINRSNFLVKAQNRCYLSDGINYTVYPLIPSSKFLGRINNEALCFYNNSELFKVTKDKIVKIGELPSLANYFTQNLKPFFYVDKKAHIWIVTGSDINYYQDSSFITIKKDIIDQNSIQAFEDSLHNVWFITETQVFYFDGAKINFFKNYPLKERPIDLKGKLLTDKIILNYCESNNNIFISYYSMAQYNKNQTYTYCPYESTSFFVMNLTTAERYFPLVKDELIDYRILSLFADKNGNVYADTPTLIYKLSNFE